MLRADANFEDLYKQGREAYLDNNYPDCVKYIEAALRNSVFFFKSCLSKRKAFLT